MFNIPEVCYCGKRLFNRSDTRYNSHMSRKRSKAHAEYTKDVLLRRAEKRFAEVGYANTSINEIVEQEQLTKGALYYYFKDKRDLFGHVVDRLVSEMVESVRQAIDREDDPWKRAVAAIETYVEGCLRPAYRQIVLREAPAILGWAAWRDKEKHSVMGLSTMLLQELMAAGLIRQQAVAMPACVLFGAVTEAAIGIAESDDPVEARKQASAVLVRFIQAL